MSKKGEEAHNQWIERQKSGHLGTETKDMGHLTEETEGMKHHHDPIDADHAPEAEFIANNNVKGRKMLGDEATKNNEAWMKRQQSGKLHTEAADIGHVGADTAASRGQKGKKNPKKSESTLAHEAWMKRQQSGKLHTEAADIGHVGADTAASRSGHGKRGSKKDASTKAHEDWLKRQQSGRLSTEADSLGGKLGEETAASKANQSAAKKQRNKQRTKAGTPRSSSKVGAAYSRNARSSNDQFGQTPKKNSSADDESLGFWRKVGRAIVGVWTHLRGGKAQSDNELEAIEAISKASGAKHRSGSAGGKGKKNKGKGKGKGSIGSKM